MAMRNLTEPFILMRNEALKSKHTYFDKIMSNQIALIASDSESPDEIDLKDINLGLDATPAWTEALEEIQYILSGLRVKIDSLVELHAKQLTRPTLEDISQEERQMEQLTREIGRAFSNGYHQIQTIKAAAEDAKECVGRRLATSAVMALSIALQEMALRYRSAQHHYLTQVMSREGGSNQFFTGDQTMFLDNAATDKWLMESNEINLDSWVNRKQHQQQEQRQNSVLLQLEDPEDRMKLAVEREEQIGNIIQSIADLKHILKDLASTVQNHGTILDRIDYNIEQTEMQVQEGNVQVKKSISLRRSKAEFVCLVGLIVFIGSEKRVYIMHDLGKKYLSIKSFGEFMIQCRQEHNVEYNLAGTNFIFVAVSVILFILMLEIIP